MPEKLKETKVTTSIGEKRGARISKMNLTMIAKCDCVNDYMDKTYGKGMRIKNSSSSGFRCVVCGK